MERKKLIVCYSGSGVKSLRVLSTFFVLLAAIGVIMIFVGMNTNFELYNGYHSSSEGDFFIIFGISAILTCCIFTPIFRGLATIAETALIKKHLIQKEYKIVDELRKWNTAHLNEDLTNAIQKEKQESPLKRFLPK
jgi:TRAP-type mannitol/chloroaromatic compound transport system permease small subunit